MLDVLFSISGIPIILLGYNFYQHKGLKSAILQISLFFAMVLMLRFLVDALQMKLVLASPIIVYIYAVLARKR